MSLIEIKSPTRVDLAGGTLDLWPLYNFIGTATTVNMAIDVWTQVRLEKTSDKKITIKSQDLGIEKTYYSLEEALADSDSKLKLLQCQLNYWQPEPGFKLETSSQSPVGGGLGGSSSLTISLLKAFSKYTGRAFKSVNDKKQKATKNY